MTKKDRKARVRNILDMYGYYQPLLPSHLEELQMMIERPDIEKAWKQPNPQFPKDTRHLYVQTDEGILTSVSWVKAIDKPNPTSSLKRTLRRSIQPDLNDFLQAVEPKSCTFCGSTNDLTTDHVDPPFDNIADEFIKQYGPVKVVKSADKVGYVIQDIDVEADWITFHARHATYQLLCRSCNASKGKRR